MFNRVIEFIERKKIKKRLNLDYTPHIRRGMQLIGAKYIKVGKSFSAGENVILEAWDSHCNQKFTPFIEIGDEVFINRRTHITSISFISIGSNVLIGSDVLISDNNHGGSKSKGDLLSHPRTRDLISKGPVVIENDVWIGDKVIILGNVKIGCNSIIGAGSVVTKDIPAYSVAVGNPAKIVRKFK